MEQVNVIPQDVLEERGWTFETQEISGGSTDHSALTEESRALTDQHPIGAITGLQDALDTSSQNVTNLQTEIDTLSGDVSSKASQADLTAEVSARQSADTSINAKIPSTASATNKLADQAFVNSSIQNLAANRVTYDANGAGFPTKADLLNATTVYHNGQPYVPTKGDYCIVIVDETAPAPYTGGQVRYEYSGAEWDYTFGINERPFTAAENAAIGSGVTSAKVATYDTHVASTGNPHNVTAAQVGLGNVNNTSDMNKPVSTATQAYVTGIVGNINSVLDAINGTVA